MPEKIRVSKIVKEYGIAYKDLKRTATELGIEIKSNFSSVTKTEAKKILDKLTAGAKEKKTKIKKTIVSKKPATKGKKEKKREVAKKKTTAISVKKNKTTTTKAKSGAKVKVKYKKGKEEKKKTRTTRIKEKVKERPRRVIKKIAIKPSDSEMTKKLIDRVYEIKAHKTSIKGDYSVPPHEVKEREKQPVQEKRKPRPPNSKVSRTTSSRNIELKKHKKIKRRYKDRKKTQLSEQESAALIKIRENITVKELADTIDYDIETIINLLQEGGVYFKPNQKMNSDLLYHVLDELSITNYEIISLETVSTETKGGVSEVIPRKDLIMSTRAPIVTIMGHIDHGKTTLLDAIRNTNVASRESGLITQHVSAYQVETAEGKITFIDTPGHSAFTAMRARGANVTDIVIIVVAGDDGVMPQTIESINHARAGGVPIIVAINKIDKEGINTEKVKKQLVEQNLNPFDWGGNTNVIEVSAKQGTNIDELLMSIHIVASELNLSVPINVPARGAVIESHIAKGQGPVATVILEEGKLIPGDAFICGLCLGKVKTICDYNGNRISEAVPASPAEISGFNQLPEPGDILLFQKTESEAKNIAKLRNDTLRETNRPQEIKITVEDFFKKTSSSQQEISIIAKVDVMGTLEVVRDMIGNSSSEEVTFKIIHSSVGEISENDVLLAKASNAIVVGFKSKINAIALKTARSNNVQFRIFDVIYALADYLKKISEDKIMIEKQEKLTGTARILKVFKISKVGNIAGCMVLDGEIRRDSITKILRGEEEVYKGKIINLKHQKESVNIIKKGFECGIRFQNFEDFKEDDIIESYIEE